VNVLEGCNTANYQQKHPAARCGLRNAQSDDDANANANTMLCYEQFTTRILVWAKLVITHCTIKLNVCICLGCSWGGSRRQSPGAAK